MKEIGDWISLLLTVSYYGASSLIYRCGMVAVMPHNAICSKKSEEREVFCKGFSK